MTFIFNINIATDALFPKPNAIVDDDDDVFEKIDNPFSLSQRPSQKVVKLSFARKPAHGNSDDESAPNAKPEKSIAGFGAGSLPRSVSAGNVFSHDGRSKNGIRLSLYFTF